jgi:hypothetical protein
MRVLEWRVSPVHGVGLAGIHSDKQTECKIISTNRSHRDVPLQADIQMLENPGEINMKRTVVVLTATFAFVASAAAQQDRRDRDGTFVDIIPAGTRIPVRLDQTIDIRVPSDGRVFTGSVEEDVIGSAGGAIIPRGAKTELIVQNIGSREATVDLESITFNGRRYMVEADRYNLSRKVGVGTNERTAKYVGGGAIFGTLLGAIAGGGKGAAIGALAGGAAGAGAQTVTRGEAVRVSAESILTFRLDEPLRVAVRPYDQDAGYDRDGYHYHDNYYRRDRFRQ